MTQNMKGEEEKTELGISQSQVRATIFYLGQGHHLPSGVELVIKEGQDMAKKKNHNSKTKKERTENQGKPPREVGGLS